MAKRTTAERKEYALGLQKYEDSEKVLRVWCKVQVVAERDSLNYMEVYNN